LSLPRSRRWGPILAAAAAAAGVAGLGALATDIGPWYYGLEKPPWKPPDWLFGPAWTVIFALAAASAVTGWWSLRTHTGRRRMLVLFGINGVLNVLWSVLFFRLHRPDWALYEVGFFWLSIVALIIFLAPASRRASWLLVPYLAWVAFAGFLNLEIVRLNGPF